MPVAELLQHKLIRGAKKTSVLKQLITRYNKYAEVVPDSDSDEAAHKARERENKKRRKRCST